MAVGFNSTWGSGITDGVQTAYASSSTIRTIAVSYRARALTHLMRIFGKVDDWDVFYSTAGGGRWEVYTRWSTTDGAWYWTSGITLNTWYHLAIVYDGGSTSNVPTVYLDGSSQSLTSFSTPVGTFPKVGTNNLRWGNYTTTRALDGALRDCACWEGALSAADITALSKGASPRLIRPDILVTESEMQKTSTASMDRFAGPATVTGTADYGNHVNIKPSAQILQFPPSAAAQINTTQRAIYSHSPYGSFPYSDIKGEYAAAPGGGFTAYPYGQQHLDRQFAGMAAAKLGGVLQ